MTESHLLGNWRAPKGTFWVTGGRAGHFWYFLIFSIAKNDLLHFFSSFLDWEWAFYIGLVQKWVNFIKNAKKPLFLSLKKFKNTSSAQLSWKAPKGTFWVPGNGT